MASYDDLLEAPAGGYDDLIPAGGYDDLIPTKAEAAPVKGFYRAASESVGNLLKGVGAIKEGLDTSNVRHLMQQAAMNEAQPTIETPEAQAGLKELEDPYAVLSRIRNRPSYKAGQFITEHAPEVFPLSPAEQQSKITKAAEMAGGFVPVLAGPAAPLAMGVESAGQHISDDYEKLYQTAIAAGTSEQTAKESAASAAMDRAVTSGALQAGVFWVLPKPVRGVLEKYLVDRFGEAGFTRWLTGRIAAGTEGATIGATSRTGENIVNEEPITTGIGGSAGGLALMNVLLPWLKAKPEATPNIGDEGVRKLAESVKPPPEGYADLVPPKPEALPAEQLKDIGSELQSELTRRQIAKPVSEKPTVGPENALNAPESVTGSPDIATGEQSLPQPEPARAAGVKTEEPGFDMTPEQEAELIEREELGGIQSKPATADKPVPTEAVPVAGSSDQDLHDAISNAFSSAMESLKREGWTFDPQWGPLELVLNKHELGQWMFMGKHPNPYSTGKFLYEYKNGITRRYLRLDDEGISYGYRGDYEGPDERQRYPMVPLQEAIDRAYEGLSEMGHTRHTEYNRDFIEARNKALLKAGFGVSRATPEGTLTAMPKAAEQPPQVVTGEPGTRETLPGEPNVTGPVTQPSGVKPVRAEVGKYTVLDAVKDHGGLGGPDLEDAMREMEGGKTASQVLKPYGAEYDSLSDALESIFEARRKRKNGSEARALSKAYQNAGFGGNRRGADRTYQALVDAQAEGHGFPGGLPRDAGDLVTRAWETATGRALPAPEERAQTFWNAVDDPNSKIGLQKVNVQDLHVGDKFRIRGKGISHEELTVSHVDPDTGEVQVKDGPKIGTLTLPDGAEIWVQKGIDRGGKIIREEPPLFGKPESVEEQKARLELETKRKKELADREEIARRQAKPLIGKQGDIGQKDMFGGGDLFSEEATPEALDRNALHFYGRRYSELTEAQQKAISEAVTTERPPVQGRKSVAAPSGREPVTGREPVQTQRLPERPSGEIQRASPAAAPEKLSPVPKDSPITDRQKSAIVEALKRLRDRALAEADHLRELSDKGLLNEKESPGQIGYQTGRILAFDDALDAVRNNNFERIASAYERHKSELADYQREHQHGAAKTGRTSELLAERRLAGERDALDDIQRVLKEGQAIVYDISEPEKSGQMRLLEKPIEQRGARGGNLSTLGFLDPANYRGVLSEDARDHLKLTAKWAVDKWTKISNRVIRSKPYEYVSKLKDAADNISNVLGKQTANGVLHELNRQFGEPAKKVKDARNALRENALTFAIEADGERNELGRMKYALMNANAEAVHAIWKRRAIAAIEFAEENWDRLQPVAQLYKRITTAQRDYEAAHGLRSTRVSGGYVMHVQDVDTSFGNLRAGSTGQGGGAPQPFNHIRDHTTYADAIANGIVPESLNALDLLQRRVSLGQRLVRYGEWIDGLRDLNDPKSQTPVISDVIERPRADGSTDITAPAGYGLYDFGGRQVALHSGYAGLMGDLTSQSWMQGSEFRKAVMNWAGVAKHTALLFDTYHMGRLAFWNAVTRFGVPRYERGMTLLDNTTGEIQRMIRNGEIPEAWGKDLLESKRKLQLMLQEGMNVGNIGDNLYTDFLQKIPALGTFNKWLFNKYQRGAMSEVGLIEFDRQKKMYPTETDAQIARRVAKDVNTRFGNLQSQSWIKSRTGQDLARLIFLAPQWNESLIRAELGALRQLGSSGVSLAKGRLEMGALARGVGTAMLGIFIGNQLLNYATRGKPTWENEEEGFGSKISAWIPDWIGGGPGFFLNPMSVPAEITHMLMRGTEKHGGDFGLALKDYFAGRMSNLTKGIYTFFAGETPIGEKATSGLDRAKKIGQQMIPSPISGGAFVRGMKQLVTGEHQEKWPGQFQKQIMQSAGIKTEQAPAPERRITELAKNFERSKGISEKPGVDLPVYGELTSAIRRGNISDAQDALEKLLETAKDNGEKRTLRDIADHYRQWAQRSFSYSKALERQFYDSLSPEQQRTYMKARNERGDVAKKVGELLKAKAQAQ